MSTNQFTENSYKQTLTELFRRMGKPYCGLCSDRQRKDRRGGYVIHYIFMD